MAFFQRQLENVSRMSILPSHCVASQGVVATAFRKCTQMHILGSKKTSAGLRTKRSINYAIMCSASRVPEVADGMAVTRNTNGKGASSSSTGWNSFEPRGMKMKAVVTVIKKITGKWSSKPTEDLSDKLVAIADQFGLANVFLQLVSVDIDPRTRVGKRSALVKVGNWGQKGDVKADKVQYTAEFVLAKEFGTPGAILVHNNHQKEFYLESISLQSSGGVDIYFPCQSWVQPANVNNHQPERIFFSNQVYLPSETPEGIKDLRQIELKALRGNGRGERQYWERIYDYATYNDLGDPDKGKDHVRATVGANSKLPYPRRCRTGRPPNKSDRSTESRTIVGGKIYVPRDETFSPLKETTFIDSCVKGLGHKLAQSLQTKLTDVPVSEEGPQFKSFADIDKMYSFATDTHHQESSKVGLGSISQDGGILKAPADFWKQFPFIHEVMREDWDSGFDLNYPVPEIASSTSRLNVFEVRGEGLDLDPSCLQDAIQSTEDRFAWIRDEEFARQLLAGENPCTIECLKVFPPVSGLQEDEYGPKTSAITAAHIQHELDGLSVQEALQQKKLFILDYHDIFMPFINAINSLEGRKTYASRTILFLTRDGRLKPLAIELSLPPGQNGATGSQRVFTPEESNYWVWTMAKTHVCCNDAGHHQLVSHWLRTHAVTEPYVIASHRHLSALHPIAKLLKPHLRYTLEINGAARQNLIAADGVIENNIDSSNADPVTKTLFKFIGTLSLESCFTPGRYCMEMSSAVYKNLWRFDMEALPADLIRRGMAEEDPNAPQGLKLMVEDYPYAADGLLLWSAIKSWVADYVSIYYKDPATIINDEELQKWWAEIRIVGHADKKNEPWWPKLETDRDLVGILTTIIWITSGHHAAVNFGQFAYAGYVPNRPCLTRRLIPAEGQPEYEDFLKDPQSYFMSMLPTQQQATVMMMIIEALSAHSPDEEYLGQRKQRWTSDDEAVRAFQRFSDNMINAENVIVERNRNSKNRNRNEAPYELLFPRSGPGITGRGVPNSVSI